MKNESKNLNSCICKCGSISCSKIQILSSMKNSQNNIFDDNLVYSILHHKSLHVHNSKSIIVDKCCGNSLFFHCSECKEHFTIIKLQSSKIKLVIGFELNCLRKFDHLQSSKIVLIPEFPIVLKSFVSLLEQKKIERTTNNENSLLLSNCSLNDLEDDEYDEICSFDSDEDLMFGKQQNNFIIGKYNEHYISSF